MTLTSRLHRQKGHQRERLVHLHLRTTCFCLPEQNTRIVARRREWTGWRRAPGCAPQPNLAQTMRLEREHCCAPQGREAAVESRAGGSGGGRGLSMPGLSRSAACTLANNPGLRPACVSEALQQRSLHGLYQRIDAAVAIWQAAVDLHRDGGGSGGHRGDGASCAEETSRARRKWRLVASGQKVSFRIICLCAHARTQACLHARACKRLLMLACGCAGRRKRRR